MPELSKKKVIALTGTMGSGKTTVAALLKTQYPVFNCDEANRDLLKKNRAGYMSLLEQGFNFLDEEGQIDKIRMASVVFKDESARKKVESILHPLIFKEMEYWISQQESDLLFVEIPLLFEIHAESYFDMIWCVVADKEIALERLKMGRNISHLQAVERWNAQFSVEYQIRHSHYVIYNNGSLDELRRQIEIGLERSRQWS